MAGVVTVTVLLMSICSSLAVLEKVTVLKEEHGKDVKIQCATEKFPQDGVSMWKKEPQETQPELVFYFYKDNSFSPTEAYKSRVAWSGELFNLTVTFLNLTHLDIGLYWCEFNFEDKSTAGSGTWLWITDQRMLSFSECPENVLPMYVKIVLILCVIITLLCITGFACVTVKVNSGRKYKPTKQPPDSSVYEEMSRNKLNCVSTLINPEYQSTKHLQ